MYEVCYNPDIEQAEKQKYFCAAESVPPKAQDGHILIAAAFDSE
jgi:hypothetical protein